MSAEDMAKDARPPGTRVRFDLTWEDDVLRASNVQRTRGTWARERSVHGGPELPNDLGLVFFVTLGRSTPPRIRAVPIKVGYCATDLARGQEASWIADRFRSSCRAFGARIRVNDEGWLDVESGT